MDIDNQFSEFKRLIDRVHAEQSTEQPARVHAAKDPVTGSVLRNADSNTRRPGTLNARDPNARQLSGQIRQLKQLEMQLKSQSSRLKNDCDLLANSKKEFANYCKETEAAHRARAFELETAEARLEVEQHEHKQKQKAVQLQADDIECQRVTLRQEAASKMAEIQAQRDAQLAEHEAGQAQLKVAMKALARQQAELDQRIRKFEEQLEQAKRTRASSDQERTLQQKEENQTLANQARDHSQERADFVQKVAQFKEVRSRLRNKLSEFRRQTRHLKQEQLEFENHRQEFEKRQQEFDQHQQEFEKRRQEFEQNRKDNLAQPRQPGSQLPKPAMVASDIQQPESGDIANDFPTPVPAAYEDARNHQMTVDRMQMDFLQNLRTMENEKGSRLGLVEWIRTLFNKSP